MSTTVEREDSNLEGTWDWLSTPSDSLIEHIFIHGLGSGSIKTWQFKPDLSYLWPKEWLPHHRAFRDVRIHAFGYDSDCGQKGGTCLDIPDFGQAFLAAMRNSEGFNTVC